MNRKWIVPIILTILLSGCASPEVQDPAEPYALLARATLGEELDIVALDQIQIKAVTPGYWDDTCLGVHLPGNDCSPTPTNGFRVILEANHQLFEYRVSEDTKTVMRVPLVEGDRAVIVLAHREDEDVDLCEDLEIYTDGAYLVKSCSEGGGTLVESYLPNEMLGQLLGWAQQTDNFVHTIPMPVITQESWVMFFGQGKNEATNEVKLGVSWMADSLYSTPAQVASEPPSPTATTPPTPSPLAGLVYANEGGLWRVENAGNSTLLINRNDAVVSPDLRYAAFMESGDLWLVNLLTGSVSNLTNTADRFEIILAWERLAPEGPLVFTSTPADSPSVAGTTGFLTVANLDGTNYQVLENEHPVQSFSVSPSGVIAWSSGGQGYVYFPGVGARPFDPSEYGLAGVTQLLAPSWSPTGNHLAWLAGVGAPEDRAFAIALFDIVQGYAVLRLPHLMPDFTPTPMAGRWDPQGNWYAVALYQDDPDQTGVWLAPAAGEAQDRFLQKTVNPVWTPSRAVIVQSVIDLGFLQYTLNDGLLAPLATPQPTYFVVQWK